jgi:ABC-type branched-subunit amino acid transport system substrate-binding protein
VTDGGVPGEGIEPSRAEAHGFLRPARLPIPPSRPGRYRVAGRHTAAIALGLLVVLLAGCGAETSGRPPGVREIAYLFDGSTDDADEVTGPALGGLRLAALGSEGVEIEPVDVGDPARAVQAIRALGDDRGVVAAVVAPWTPATEATVGALAGTGLPVFSFSWAWVAPRGAAAPWRSVSLDADGEADLLVRAGAGSAGPAEPMCVASDPLAMSRSLAGLVAARSESRAPIVDAGQVDPARPATASAVVGRIRSAGCAAVLWTGGADAAALLLAEHPPVRALIGTSRIKSDDGLALAGGGTAVVATCGCADVNLTLEETTERFVHDFQAESAAAPGPFAVEAHDVGMAALSSTPGTPTRAQVAVAIAQLDPIEGLVGPITFGPDGRRDPREIPEAWWRASGSRWLPATGPAA